MELRHIRYFLAVAEEGNFSRAAARIGIGQPPLSLQIRDLEQEVGARLFRRLPHGAALTEAGVAFRAVVQVMPGLAQEAIRQARRAEAGETGILRVGFTGSATLNPILPRTIRVFQERYPEVELTLSEDNSVGLEKGLVDGTIDIAFLRAPLDEGDKLRVHPFPDEPMVLALPVNHRLARGLEEDPVRLAELKEDAFILTPRAIGSTIVDAAWEACGQAGFSPARVRTAPQMVSVLSLVAAGQGVSIVPTSMTQLALDGVAYRQISDAQPSAGLAIAHARSNLSQLVRNFLLVARPIGDGEDGMAPAQTDAD